MDVLLRYKRWLLGAALLVLAVALYFGVSSAPVGSDSVYVCYSGTSVAYHRTSGCNGLGRCTHEVKQMSVADAQSNGKRACRKCY